jgi:CRP-like cAMP-binding protein
MADFTDTLSQVPLFAKLSKKELKRIAGQMSERTFSAGETITTEGEGGVGFFVIEDGDATVTVRGGEVGTLGPGDYFGEIALIDKGPRSATIVADTEMRCRGMTSWEFRPMVQENSEMAWPLLEALVGRLRETEKRASG